MALVTIDGTMEEGSIDKIYKFNSSYVKRREREKEKLNDPETLYLLKRVTAENVG